MSRVDLTAFFKRAAEQAKRQMAAKLSSGRGVRGRVLPKKKVSNGRPLGFGESAQGIPGLLREGPVRAFRNGFTIFYKSRRKVGWFHRGFQPQNRPPRPVAGLSKAQEDRILKDATDEAAKQVNAILKRRR